MTTPEPDQVAEVLARHRCLDQHPDRHDWKYGTGTCSACASWGATTADALKAAGLVVEGTEVEEWGVRRHDGTVIQGNRTEHVARAWFAAGDSSIDQAIVRRTRTTYPDRVTEWVAVDEGGE